VVEIGGVAGFLTLLNVGFHERHFGFTPDTGRHIRET
jgi:hypothetical protein